MINNPQQPNVQPIAPVVGVDPNQQLAELQAQIAAQQLQAPVTTPLSASTANMLAPQQGGIFDAIGKHVVGTQQQAKEEQANAQNAQLKQAALDRDLAKDKITALKEQRALKANVETYDKFLANPANIEWMSTKGYGDVRALIESGELKAADLLQERRNDKLETARGNKSKKETLQQATKIWAQLIKFNPEVNTPSNKAAFFANPENAAKASEILASRASTQVGIDFKHLQDPNRRRAILRAQDVEGSFGKAINNLFGRELASDPAFRAQTMESAMNRLNAIIDGGDGKLTKDLFPTIVKNIRDAGSDNGPVVKHPKHGYLNLTNPDKRTQGIIEDVSEYLQANENVPPLVAQQRAREFLRSGKSLGFVEQARDASGLTGLQRLVINPLSNALDAVYPKALQDAPTPPAPAQVNKEDLSYLDALGRSMTGGF